mmetsp:Transcript_2206/g.3272  ORF Transcript_2206/g.3272 Transcript_2206/m.3272 type:complete len:339 (-) Transcript_2206:263-1279(-)|eukprot:CAMPEP_0194219174 /NCGR_PEP_ID=MMETSP0156-20130528/25336_1 /TAXON_ID=33649 /ORGANISM="Thalassionema nitzschioides, Strain L26-B" /LENGTH=338 /DNA_ID=CAMNT_0038948741 /DNA_START=67 /DNA_END=1083 /DNA_ORIENTATION=+
MRFFRIKKKKTAAVSSPTQNVSKEAEKGPIETTSRAAFSLDTAASSDAVEVDVNNNVSTHMDCEEEELVEELDEELDEETAKLYSDAKILHQEFPTAAYEECIRMRILRTMKSARKNLNAYIEWRETYRLEKLISDSPTFEADSQIWDYAVKHALSFFPDVELEEKLPRYVRIIGVKPSKKNANKKKNDGKGSSCYRRTMYVMSGLIDVKIASLDIYALAFAMYFFLVTDRDSLEYVNVLIDNSSGEGWPNCSTSTLYPIAKKLQLHLNHFPQRLTKFYAYPVPLAAQLLWTLCKQFLKPSVVAKINIHWGYDADVPAKWNFDQATLEDIHRERNSEM